MTLVRLTTSRVLCLLCAAIVCSGPLWFSLAPSSSLLLALGIAIGTNHMGTTSATCDQRGSAYNPRSSHHDDERRSVGPNICEATAAPKAGDDPDAPKVGSPSQ